jgi:membrane associated rhomboid family serine protease
MAGRFSFSVPERRNFGDPWFRIGTLEVTTTVLVVLLSVAGMFLWAIDEASWLKLVLFPDLVRDGEVWRIVTWPIANEAGLWPVLTLAIFWYFGREIEGLLGRTRFAVLLLLLAVIPGIVGTLIDWPQASLRPIELAVFLLFVGEYPFARFFFGIPAWAIGAVFLGIELLQLLNESNQEGILFLFVTIATAAITARSMGLLSSLPWIPAIPIGRGSSGSTKRRSPRRRSGSGSGGGGEVVAGPWTSSSSGPARSSRLPQPPPSTAYNADQAELDALLDKISDKGMDGLSGDEKRRLNELSKRMRNRK